MKWSQVEQRIRTQVIAGTTSVLKCDGVERRAVTSNSGQKIGMRTGAATKHTKAITYEMLQYGFEVLQAQGRFDSGDFRARFGAKYRAAPCRYSMTGGVLVEIGAAILVPGDAEEGCHYLKAADPEQ